MDTHDPTLAITLVAVLGAAAQWLAWRLHIPGIVLLTAAGLIVGPWLGLLHPTRQFGALLPPFIRLAVAVILFEGGLRLKLHDLHEAARGVKRMCSLVLLLAWGLGTLAAWFVGGLDPAVATLFGALLVVTGPTVIMPLLRQARLKPRTASLFKWEGIVNDPLGALLVVLVYEVAAHGDSPGELAQRIAVAVVVGGGLGALAGWGLGWLFRHGKVPEFQKAPALVSAVLGVATLADTFQHEAGLLAVTAMGIVLGNSGIASLAELTRFKDAISLVLVSSVFLLVSADVDPATLASLDLRHFGLLACVLLVVRPAAVMLGTVGAGMERNERLLLAWIAPRGVVAAAVAGVFGPRLVEAGYPDGALLVPLVFATILLTVVLHGFTLGGLAKRLGLSAGSRDGLLVVGSTRWSRELARVLHELDVPVLVADTSWDRLRKPRLAGVPTHFGEVLSEAGEESLPMHELNTVLAATSNDAYNALVCVHFGPELGRDRVYQLASPEVDLADRRAVLASARGRIAVDHDATHEALHARSWEGWTFRTPTLTDAYDLEAWRTEAGPEAELVAVLGSDGRLRLHGPNFQVSAGAGDTLLVFAPPGPPPEPPSGTSGEASGATGEEASSAGKATEEAAATQEP